MKNFATLLLLVLVSVFSTPASAATANLSYTPRPDNGLVVDMKINMSDSSYQLADYYNYTIQLSDGHTITGTLTDSLYGTGQNIDVIYASMTVPNTFATSGIYTANLEVTRLRFDGYLGMDSIKMYDTINVNIAWCQPSVNVERLSDQQYRFTNTTQLIPDAYQNVFHWNFASDRETTAPYYFYTDDQGTHYEGESLTKSYTRPNDTMFFTQEIFLNHVGVCRRTVSVVLDLSTGIDEANAEQTEIFCFNKQVTIVTAANLSEVSIYNALGQQVQSIRPNGNSTLQIPVSNYIAGNYFVYVKADNNTIKTKQIFVN